MTRANPGEFYQIDLEVEQKLRKLHKRLHFGCSIKGSSSISKATTNGKNIDERINGLEKKIDDLVNLFKTSNPQVARVC